MGIEMSNTNSSSKRVLVDVDGTICQNLPRLCDYLELTYDITLRPEQVTEWSYEFDEIDKNIGDVFDSLFEERPEWYLSNLSPVEGSQRGLRELRANGYEVWIVTHRPAETHQLTKDWLEKCGFEYDKFVEQVPENKGKVPGAVLVDDYHQHVLDAAQVGKQGILMDHPYNCDPSHESVRVANSWNDVVTFLCGS